MKKKAFITGITGQDGSYLAQFLLQKGYEVHGMHRRSSMTNLKRLQELLKESSDDIVLHHGDLTDGANLCKILEKIEPDEIYNLAAQSHVAISFEMPEYTADVNGLGALRILEAIRVLKMEKKTRFYQASTSELFGDTKEAPQKETTPFRPRSPYAAAKLYAYWITVNYRESYNFFACNGILFNHESPLRGEEFVTRKITRGLARVFLGIDRCLQLGNLNAKRDWGHAKDFVEMQWMILQQDKPDDYIIATGRQHTVREFVTQVAKCLGLGIHWEGKGHEEKGIIASTQSQGKLSVGQTIVSVDPKYFRPAEVENLLGDASKATQQLGWLPKITFEDLVNEMIEHDLKLARRFLSTRNP